MGRDGFRWGKMKVRSTVASSASGQSSGAFCSSSCCYGAERMANLLTLPRRAVDDVIERELLMWRRRKTSFQQPQCSDVARSAQV